MLVEKLFCSFVNPLISSCIYYDQYMKNMEKKIIFFPKFVSMEIASIFDVKALTKVRITLKPVLQIRAGQEYFECT